MCKRIFFLWLSNIHDLTHTHTPLFFFVNGFCIMRSTWWITGPHNTYWHVVVDPGHRPGLPNTYLYYVVGGGAGRPERGRSGSSGA